MVTGPVYTVLFQRNLNLRKMGCQQSAIRPTPEQPSFYITSCPVVRRSGHVQAQKCHIEQGPQYTSSLESKSESSFRSRNAVKTIAILVNTRFGCEEYDNKLADRHQRTLCVCLYNSYLSLTRIYALHPCLLDVHTLTLHSSSSSMV